MPFTPFVPTIGGASPPLSPALGGTGQTSLPLTIANGGTGQITALAALAALGGMSLQSTTGVGGFALQNATPTILTWTPPNDGLMHRAMVLGEVIVGTAETGGAIQCNFNTPDAVLRGRTLQAGGAAAGYAALTLMMITVQGGAAVQVVQQSALTAGAATLYAELWGL